jgi:hypothetical protein
MGRNARRRRSQRRCQQDRTTHLAPRDPRAPRSAEALVHELLMRPDPASPDAVRRLRALPDAPQALEGAVLAMLERAWDIGWQPRDLVRYAARATDLATNVRDAVAVECRSYHDSPVADPRWLDQLRDIGALDDDGPTASAVVSAPEQVATALRVLRLLARLVPLPRIADPPHQWTARDVGSEGAARAADAVVAKVRGLLAKAESTDYPAEAEALSAKAQELIARHAIDRALLAAERGDEPVARRIPIDEPYAEAKCALLAHVAHANRCRTVWMSALGASTLVGFASDVDDVELLFSSLLVQATRAVASIGRHAPPGDRTRSRAYRRSFLYGFANQIGQRLRETTERETAEAAERHGPQLLPVLASREAATEQRVAELFPRVRSTRTRVSDGDGWVAGNAAGKLASLALDHEVAPHLPS